MSDVAAHLVDDVLPEVPVRQWVCSLPWGLRTALAYDRELCADVLGAFVAALERSLRRRAKRALGLASLEQALFGALTVVQRADSALRVNPHFHTLALDGVYVREPQGALVFHALGAPEPGDLLDVARWTHAGLVRALGRHGRSLETPEDESFACEQPVLASVVSASAADVQALGTAPGRRTTKLVRAVRSVPAPLALHAEVGGVDVHAERAVDGRDRPQLERLCRYLLRPPLALDRLERHHDGRIRYAFKRAWKDGTHAVVLDPLDLLARLAALVPPPRFHMLRYHGVLASNSCVRTEVVPKRPEPKTQLPLFGPGELGHLEPPPEPSRHPWAWLLRRVFQIDVSVCERCGGRMRVVEIAQDPADAARVLAELGLGARAPPRPSPVGSPRQMMLPFAG